MRENMNRKFSIIYVTSGDMNEAKKIGRKLVEEGLVACANIFPIVSIFRWKGNIDEANEFAIMLKTRSDAIKKIETVIKEIHSYDVPCIVSFDIDEGSEEYLKWIHESVDMK
jgi:periplasmic divalent cation tolerance protein